MLNSSSNIESAQSCNCYKKLDFLGIPLYISEETEYGAEYGEYSEREKAFPIPNYVNINEFVTAYPVVEENETFFVFQLMSEVIPCLADFELNVLSFWMLDVFIEGLKTAQAARMSHEHQKATLKWIAYFFNYIKDRNPNRRGLFNQLKRILFYSDDSKGSEGEETNVSKPSAVTLMMNETDSSESSAKSPWQLPMPPSLVDGFTEDRRSESSSDLTSKSDSTDITSSMSNQSTDDPAKNLMSMKIIVEILYRIFGRFWAFVEIQAAFHSMPSLEKVNLPFTLNIPKPTKKPEAPHSPTKTEKTIKKTTLVLEKSPEEIEEERQLHKHDYILPLQDCEESKFYMKEIFGISSSEQIVPEKGKNKK